jgi:7-cyano-7-deazaguanine synthase
MARSEAQSDNGLAVVLLSGGLDSATVLAIAQSEGRRCHCVSFDYGQRHRSELDAGGRIAKRAGASHQIVPLDAKLFAGSALTGAAEVPKDRTDSEIEGGIPVTYVPARNLVFLSVCTGIAEVLGAGEIFIGVNQLDYSGYPDCRDEFIQAFERAANLATKAGVEGRALIIRTPLINMTKAQIIATGDTLGVDYALTQSCYDPDRRGRACGRCDSCQLRRKGFAEAGVEDPTRYQRDIKPPEAARH